LDITFAGQFIDVPVCFSGPDIMPRTMVQEYYFFHVIII